MTDAEPEPPREISWQSLAPRLLANAQGLFYALTGLWPLLHVRSFLAVTGPKVDVWLTQTVGALIAVTGLTLLVVAKRRRLGPEWALLAGGQAVTLGLIDIVFVARERIPPIYLADAIVELFLAASWLVLAARRYQPTG